MGFELLMKSGWSLTMFGVVIVIYNKYAIDHNTKRTDAVRGLRENTGLQGFEKFGLTIEGR